MSGNLEFEICPDSGGEARRDRVEPIPSSPLRRGFCDWCGGRCRRGRTYCSSRCQVQYNNLLTRQGKALVQSLKLWRLHRGRKGTPGAGMMTRVSARVDALLAEDRRRWEEAGGQDDQGS